MPEGLSYRTGRVSVKREIPSYAGTHSKIRLRVCCINGFNDKRSPVVTKDLFKK